MQPLSIQRQFRHILAIRTLVTLSDNRTGAVIHSNSTNQDSPTMLVPSHKCKRRLQDRLAQHSIIQTNNTAKVNINTRLIFSPQTKPSTLVPIQMAAERLSQPGQPPQHTEDTTTATMRNNLLKELLQIRL
jgi:hypothetical protein